jgi:hypothetical protein
MWASSVKVPRVNNDPMGENSPNLLTLSYCRAIAQKTNNPSSNSTSAVFKNKIKKLASHPRCALSA